MSNVFSVTDHIADRNFGAC